MNNKNFNAVEINEIITKIETTETEMEKIFTNIWNNFSSLSGIVASEDSGLSKTCDRISATYKNLSGKLSDNLDAIKTELTSYVQQTLQYETNLTENLTKTNEGLESAKSILDTL